MDLSERSCCDGLGVEVGEGSVQACRKLSFQSAAYLCKRAMGGAILELTQLLAVLWRDGVAHAGNVLADLDVDGALGATELEHALGGAAVHVGAVLAVFGGGVLGVAVEEGAVVDGDAGGGVERAREAHEGDDAGGGGAQRRVRVQHGRGALEGDGGDGGRGRAQRGGARHRAQLRRHLRGAGAGVGGGGWAWWGVHDREFQGFAVSLRTHLRFRFAM